MLDEDGAINPMTGVFISRGVWELIEMQSYTGKNAMGQWRQ